jgi:hypothetical protein
MSRETDIAMIFRTIERMATDPNAEVRGDIAIVAREGLVLLGAPSGQACSAEGRLP